MAKVEKKSKKVARGGRVSPPTPPSRRPTRQQPRPTPVKAKAAGDVYAKLSSPSVKRIDNLAYFIEVMSGLKNNGGATWFRGQGSVAYDLNPGALREEDKKRRIRRLDRLDDFIRRATYRVPSPPPQDDVLHWMQIAQHYGLPTRLLDWTLNPAVALYFACSGGGADDSAVFMLRPDALNRRHVGGAGHVLNMKGDAERLIRCANDTAQLDEDQGQPIYAVQLVITFERVHAQRGAFTLHGSKYRRLDDTGDLTLRRLVVDGGSKKKILRDLANVGIDRASLFPELEQLSRHLKELDDAEGADDE